MKIIANTDTGFLVEATKAEIALLHGFETQYDKGIASSMFAIGHDIELGDIVKSAKYVRNLDSAVLEKAQKRFTELADEMHALRGLIYKLNIFEDLKQ